VPKAEAKPGLHPRNRHRGRYDFPRLVRAWPGLAPFVAVNAHGDASIDFADPEAVKALNRALLACFYHVTHWDIPPGYLCPPIPGRADCVHHLADLLAEASGGRIPKGPSVRVLDIGVGANCIYPLLGHREYGWRFLGSDIDPGALASARRILEANPGLEEAIQLRRQPQPARILEGLLQPGETFDLSLCNPPFHTSPAEAREGSIRKWRNLGKAAPGAPVRNFGGRGGELWCEGGEAAFLRRMIEESARMPGAVLWFTALVSRSENLPGLRHALRQTQAAEVRVLPMAQGQKKSRILAWTYLDEGQRRAWAAERWGGTR
jgi:23S rRNA (adenine1618-N6)-methyltransferase